MRMKALLAALLLFAVWWALWFSMIEREPREFPQPTKQERAWLKARFRYHGITSCVREGDTFYFIRDGKRCAL